MGITDTVQPGWGGLVVGMEIMAGGLRGLAGGVTGALRAGAVLGQAFKAGVIGGLIGAASGFLSFEYETWVYYRSIVLHGK